MKQRLFARDISEHHPFGKSCRTDLEYARVANAIYPILRECIKDTKEEECDWMALKTALYLEVHSIGKVLRSKGFLCRTMSGQVVPLVVS